MSLVYKRGVLAWLLAKDEKQLPVTRVSDGSILEAEAYNHPVIVLKCVWEGPSDYYTKYYVVLMTTYGTITANEYLRNREARRDSRNSIPVMHPSSKQTWPELTIGGKIFPLLWTTKESLMDRGKQSYVKLDSLIDSSLTQLRQYNENRPFDKQPELSEQSLNDLMEYFGMSEEPSQVPVQTGVSSRSTTRPELVPPSSNDSLNTNWPLPSSRSAPAEQNLPPPEDQAVEQRSAMPNESAPPTASISALAIQPRNNMASAEVRLLQCRNTFGTNTVDPSDLFAWICIDTNALPSTALFVIDRIIFRLESTIWHTYFRPYDQSAMVFFPAEGNPYPSPADMQHNSQRKLAGNRQLKSLITELDRPPSIIAIEPTYVYGRVGWYVREDDGAKRIRDVVAQQVLGQRVRVEPSVATSIVMVMIEGQVSFVMVFDY